MKKWLEFLHITENIHVTVQQIWGVFSDDGGHLHIFKRHFFQKSFIKKSQFRYTTLCLKLRYFNENIFYHLLIKFAAQVISCLLSERDQLNSRLDRNHQNGNYISFFKVTFPLLKDNNDWLNRYCNLNIF